MGNPRSFTSKFVARKTELEACTKPLRSAKAKRAAIERAASGRPSDLSQQARISIALRRIAGTALMASQDRGRNHA